MPFLGPERVVRMRCARAASAAALLLHVVAAPASNLNFLNDTPLSYVKPRDMDSLKRALTDVLNTKSDGETSQWTNADTGNSVKIDAMMTPSDTSRDGKKTCRHVAVVLSAKGQSMNLHPVFCGTGKTDWALQKRWTSVPGTRSRPIDALELWLHHPLYLDARTGTSSFTWQAITGIRYAMKWDDMSLTYRYPAHYGSRGQLAQTLRFNGLSPNVTFRF